MKTGGKTKSIAKLKKELDIIFSKYIRYRDDGQCFTCPKKDDPKKMQCGHFVPRQYMSVRYDERNCNCQCYACNMLYNGQPSAYAVNLTKLYGEGIVEGLESHRNRVTKRTPAEYEELIIEYKAKLKELNVGK